MNIPDIPEQMSMQRLTFNEGFSDMSAPSVEGNEVIYYNHEERDVWGSINLRQAFGEKVFKNRYGVIYKREKYDPFKYICKMIVEEYNPPPKTFLQRLFG